MSRELRALEHRIKQNRAAGMADLRWLYEHDAHTALGFPSWEAFIEARFACEMRSKFPPEIADLLIGWALRVPDLRPDAG